MEELINYVLLLVVFGLMFIFLTYRANKKISKTKTNSYLAKVNDETYKERLIALIGICKKHAYYGNLPLLALELRREERRLEKEGALIDE